MKKSQEILTNKAKDLLTKCENAPYLLEGSVDDIEFLELVKEYPTLFYFDSNSVFSFSLLKKFWLNEIATYFYFLSGDECKLIDVVSSGLEAFDETYKVKHPKLSLSFANVSNTLEFTSFGDMDFFVSPWEDDGLDNDALVIAFIGKVVLVGIRDYQIEIREIVPKGMQDKFDNIIICRTDATQKSTLSEIKKLLRVVPDNKIPLNLLCHKLNSMYGEFDIKKPIDPIELHILISEGGNGRFEIDSSYYVTLVSDIEYFPKFFVEKRELLKNFNFNKPISGILAFSYLGNKFPLNEAEEYVNVRPLIHLALVKNLKEEFPKIISDLTQNEIFAPEREFIFLLKSVLPQDASVEEWLTENIAVSFYEEEAQDLKLVMPKIIGHLSPVFNLTQNPGHLFAYTLQKKLEELTRKNIGEAKSEN